MSTIRTGNIWNIFGSTARLVPNPVLAKRKAQIKEIAQLKKKYNLLHYWVVTGGKVQFKKEMRQVRKRLEYLKAQPIPTYNHVAERTECKDYFDFDRGLQKIKEEASKLKGRDVSISACERCSCTYPKETLAQIGGELHCSDCFVAKRRELLNG